MAKSILLPIVSTFNDKGVQQAKSAMGSLTDSIGKAVKGFVAYQAVAGATTFAKDLVTQASDLQRNTAGLKTVFGQNAQAMVDWTKQTASFGVSASDASKAATFLGSVLKSAGFDTAQTAEETKRLTVLAADLAATYGYDLQEALTGMTALFRGEYDPIEKFGVAIKQSQVNTVLASRDLDKLTGSALIHANQMVRLELLYAATKDAQGAFGRQTGSLYTSMAILSATFKDLEAAMGTPMLQPLADLANKFIFMVDSFKNGSTTFGKGIGDMISALSPLLVAVGSLIATFMTWFGGLSSGVSFVLTPFIQVLGTLVSGLSLVLQFLSPIAPIIGGLSAAIITFQIVSMAFLRVKSMIETVRIATFLLASAFTSLAAAETAAAVAANVLKIALVTTGIGAIVVGLGTLIGSFMSTTDATQQAADAQNAYNQALAGMPDVSSKIPNYGIGKNKFDPTTDPSYRGDKATGRGAFQYPGAPKPGETTTWWRYEQVSGVDGHRMPVWYEQTWNGTSWSKPKKVTAGTSAAKSTTTESSAEKKRKAVIKKQKDDYKSLASSVKESFKTIQESLLGAFDITTMGNSASRVLSNVRRLIEQTKQFAESIKSLQAQNLNGDLLNQLIAAGPVAAGRLAANLASSGLVGDLSAAYSEYGGLASGIATSGVQGMYGAGSSKYNITIAAGLGSKEQIAKAVVEAIKYYEKNNGGKK